MWSKRRIAGVSAGTSIGTIIVVTIMLLPTIYPAIQNHYVRIYVNTGLPYVGTWDTGTVTLDLRDVTEETILVATFEVETIPTNSTFGSYGSIDDFITIFVFTLISNKTISFNANSGMKLTLERIYRGGTVEGYDDFTVKGMTYSQIWDGYGANVSILNKNIYHNISLYTPDKLSYFSVTEGEVSTYEVVDNEWANVTLPFKTEYLIFISDSLTPFELKVTHCLPVINPVFNPYLIAVAGMNQTVDPEEVTFFNGRNSTCAKSEIIEYLWDFGDGFNDTGIEASHTYANDGIYTVVLTVIDSEGFTNSDTLQITVNNLAPSADAGEYSTAFEDEIVYFNGTGIDTPLDQENLSYEWDFGDGRVGENATTGHIYNNSGDYEVVLTITDDNGAIDTDTVQATIVNRHPIADAGADQTLVKAGRDVLVNFDANMSSDTPSDLPYLQYHWDFGDGSSRYGKILSHVYHNLGTYQVTLTVMDDDGAIDTDTAIITIENSLPVAEAGPNQVLYTNEIVNFDGSNSYDPDGGEIQSYLWDFGDGGAGQGKLVSHIYLDDGIYVVTLTVTDDEGYTDTDTCIITILNRPPVAVAETYQLVNMTLRVAGKKWNNVSLSVCENDILLDNIEIQRTPGSPDKQSKSLVIYLDIQQSNKIILTYNAKALGDNPVWVDITFDDNHTETFSIDFNVATLDDTQYRERDLNGVLSRGRITFNATNSYDTDTNPNDEIPYLRYLWDFGDGNTSTDEISSHAYGEDGTYQVSLTVIDDDDAIDTIIFPVTIYAHYPQACAGVKSSISDVDVIGLKEFHSEVGNNIMFDGTESYDPDNNGLSYLWNFGDGNIGTNMISTHTYVCAGTYAVELTVTDSTGLNDSDTLLMIVSAPGYPVADAGPDLLVYKNHVVEFNGLNSYDPDGTIVSYLWDFGDGTNSPGVTVQYLYAEEGTYYVTLSVEDNDGNIGIDTAIVVVINAEPIADAGSDKDVSEDDNVIFDGSGSYDPDGGELYYSWDFDLSDGIQQDAVGMVVEHIYTLSRTYTATLTVTDDEGDPAQDTLTVLVSNVAPTANAGPDLVVYEDNLVFFNGTGIDTPSDQPLLNYTWDFNDCTVKYSANVSHVFTNSGQYSVLLIVTDDDGAVGIDEALVDVVNRPPIADAGIDLNITEGEILWFDGSGSTDTISDRDDLYYMWDFGDDATAVGIEISHIYLQKGDYTTTLTVMDDNGATDTDTMIVTVTNVAPSSDAGLEQVVYGPKVRFNGAGTDTFNDKTTLEYHWYFGDGEESTLRNPTHEYPFSGEYQAALIVTDDDGFVSEDTTIVYVHMDFDADGLPDEWEEKYGLDPRVSTGIDGPDEDLDNDELTNIQEFWARLDPKNEDSDGDGILDTIDMFFNRWEEYYGLNSLDPSDDLIDSDSDGLLNYEEFEAGSNPHVSDTDLDGIPDYSEVRDFYLYKEMAVEAYFYWPNMEFALDTKLYPKGSYRVNIFGLAIINTTNITHLSDAILVSDGSKDIAVSNDYFEVESIEGNSSCYNNYTFEFYIGDLNHPDEFVIYTNSTIFETVSPIQIYVNQISIEKEEISPIQRDSDRDGLTDIDERDYYVTSPWKSDTDEDRFWDGAEISYWMYNGLSFEGAIKFAKNPDSDGDGVPDGEEMVVWHLSPANPDTDGDTCDDGPEIAFWSALYEQQKAIVSNPEEYLPLGDIDNDGLANILDQHSDGDLLMDGYEINLRAYGPDYYSDPSKMDTDGDGLGDGEEILIYNTYPNNTDSDHDKLEDGREVNEVGTNPSDPDTDKDGLIDGHELVDENAVVEYGQGVNYGSPTTISLSRALTVPSSMDRFLLNKVHCGYDLQTDPLNPDTDGDGMPDGWELFYGLDPFDMTKEETLAVIDSDGDSLSDLQEFYFESNPIEYDSDFDGLADVSELLISFRTSIEDGALRMDNYALAEIDNDWIYLSGEIFVYKEAFTDETITYTDGKITGGFEGCSLWQETRYFTTILDGSPIYENMNEPQPKIFVWSKGADHQDRNHDGILGGTCYLFERGTPLDPVEESIYPVTDYIGMELALDTDRDDKIDALDSDADGDDIPDNWELDNNLNPYDSLDALEDYDSDGLTNVGEYKSDTDPYLWSTDQDSLPDGWEVNYGLDPKDDYGINGDFGDFDNDELTNLEEHGLGTFPNSGDTEMDGMPDGWEILHNLDPLLDDSLLDNDEGIGDGLTNVEEHYYNTDPAKIDTDEDGMPDGWEGKYGLDPDDDFGINGSDGDLDSDLLSNIDEFSHGTYPNLPDSDSDGLSDSEEISHGSDPLDTDTDNDLLSDGKEKDLGTNPIFADTDGDFISDGIEYLNYGTDPLLDDTDDDGLTDSEEINGGVDTSWTMFLNNPTHCMIAPDGPATNNLLWSKGMSGSIESSPAVKDGFVFFGDDNGYIYALYENTGLMIWSYQTGDSVKSSPAVSNGLVFVGSDDGKIYALHETDGTEAWTYPTGGAIRSSPTIKENKMFIGSDDGNLYAIDILTSTLIWTSFIGAAIRSSPAIANGHVIIGCNDGNVYTLSEETGEQIWSYSTGGPVTSSPSIADGLIFIGSEDNNIYALKEDNGEVKWIYSTGGSVSSSPVVANHTVLVGSDDNNFYAIDEFSGALKWSYPTSGGVKSSPVATENIIYFTTASKVRAVDWFGNEIWDRSCGNIISSPALGDGILFVTSTNHYVYAIGSGSVGIFEGEIPQTTSYDGGEPITSPDTQNDEYEISSENIVSDDATAYYSGGEYGTLSATEPPKTSEGVYVVMTSTIPSVARYSFYMEGYGYYIIPDGTQICLDGISFYLASETYGGSYQAATCIDSGDVTYWSITFDTTEYPDDDYSITGCWSASWTDYSLPSPITYIYMGFWYPGEMITVLNNYPPNHPDAGENQVVWRNEEVTFSGTATDPDGDALTYYWNFGDGNTDEGNPVQHTYTISQPQEDFFAKLKVFDGKEYSSEDPVIISVRNRAPTIDRPCPPPDFWTIYAERNVNERYDCLASDLDGDSLTYEWDFDIDDGGGIDSTEEKPYHTFSNPPSVPYTYRGKVWVSDGINIAWIPFITIVVNAHPRVYVGQDKTVHRNELVSFSASASDPDGTINSATWSWFFNDDGTTDNSNSATHTYNELGYNWARARVADNEGLYGYDYVYVTVVNQLGILSIDVANGGGYSITDDNIVNVPYTLVVYEGGTIPLSSIVYNYGEISTDSVVTFYDGHPDKGKLVSQESFNIASKGNLVASADWTPTAGRHTIYVVAQTFPEEYDDISNIQSIDVVVIGMADTPSRVTNPLHNDTDEDSLLDGFEIDFGSSPIEEDTDNDGLSDYTEWLIGTEPYDMDTDDDNLFDAVEAGIIGTEPTNPDTDGDGLNDGFPFEVSVIFRTNAIDTNEDSLLEYTLNTIIAIDFFPTPTDVNYVLETYQCIDDQYLVVISDYNFVDETPDGRNIYHHKIDDIVVIETDEQNEIFSLYTPISTFDLPLIVVPVLSYALSNKENYAVLALTADSDGDGLLDGDEIQQGTNPGEPDTDSDGLWDGYDIIVDGVLHKGERTYGTDPNYDDTDGDGLGDGLEVGLMGDANPSTTTNPRMLDTDKDGLPDGWVDANWDGETQAIEGEDLDLNGAVNPGDWGAGGETDPSKHDTDGDGMHDSWEINLGLDPLDSSDNLVDDDGDGLSNFWEMIYGTDPDNPDTDDDDMPDGYEVEHELNPLFDDSLEDRDMDTLLNIDEYLIYFTNPNAWDTDEDGMPDGWEVIYINTNPLIHDSEEDGDGDKLHNLHEYYWSTDPDEPDTDGDGMPDGWEANYVLHPLENDAAADKDGDLLTNFEEFELNTNPAHWDTDRDYIGDYEETQRFFTYNRILGWDYYSSSGPDVASNTEAIFLDINAWVKYDVHIPQDTDYKLVIWTTTPLDAVIVSIGGTPVTLSNIGSAYYYGYFNIPDSTYSSTPNHNFDIEITNTGSDVIQITNLIIEKKGLNPASPDTDGDGIGDRIETYVWAGSSTYPSNPDSDGDSLSDGFEIDHGLNPNPQAGVYVNTVLMLPKIGAEIFLPVFHEMDFYVFLMYVSTNPNDELNAPEDIYGNSLLREGLNEIIIPYNVLFSSKLFDLTVADVGQHMTTIPSEAVYQYYELNRDNGITTDDKKLTHISFAVSGSEACTIVNELMVDSSGNEINYGADITYEVDVLFDNVDSPDLGNIIPSFTPIRSTINLDGGIEIGSTRSGSNVQTNGAGDILSGIGTFVSDGASALGSAIVAGGTAIIDAGNVLIDDIVSTSSLIITDVSAGIGDYISDVSGLATSVIEGTVTAVTELYHAAGQAAGEVYTVIVDGATTAVQVIVDAGGVIIGTINDAMVKAGEIIIEGIYYIGDVAIKTLEAGAEFLSGVLDAMSTTFELLIEGLTAVVTEMINLFVDFVEWVKELILSIFLPPIDDLYSSAENDETGTRALYDEFVTEAIDAENNEEKSLLFVNWVKGNDAFKPSGIQSAMVFAESVLAAIGLYCGAVIIIAIIIIIIILIILFTDWDGDGLNNYDEWFMHGTKALDKDTDDDGWEDGFELSTTLTDPNVPNDRFAVLISARTAADANFDEFWNDLRIMYDILLEQGYNANNIFMLYGDGNDVTAAVSPRYGSPAGTAITTNSATINNVQTTFQNINTLMDANDFLYVMSFDHGGGYDNSWGGGSLQVNDVDEGNEIQENALRYDIGWRMNVWLNSGQDFDRDGIIDLIMLDADWNLGGVIGADNDEQIEALVDLSFNGFLGADNVLVDATGNNNFFALNDYDGDGVDDDLLCDDNLDNTIDIDLNAIVANLQSDGNDANNDGILNGLDVNEDGDENDWVGIDEVLYLQDGQVTDDWFATQINNINNFNRITIVMQQCFSGGFIDDLRDPNIIIATGGTEDQTGKRSDTEREDIDNNADGIIDNEYNHAEYLYHFQSALRGLTPAGGNVNADADNNGFVSILEAFNYAFNQDSYNDLGGNYVQHDGDNDGILDDILQENPQIDNNALAGNTYI